MLILFRKATLDIFGRSEINEEQKRIGAGFHAKFGTAIWAAWLAVAFFVPNGYPQLISLSVLGLFFFASMVRICQRDP